MVTMEACSSITQIALTDRTAEDKKNCEAKRLGDKFMIAVPAK